jgi:hypothetical protein
LIFIIQLGEITIEIDKSAIVKTISGLHGIGLITKKLGIDNKYANSSLTGELIPTIGKTYVYSAPENLAKYNWIIANGEIISSANNSVEVKWNKKGEQTLILRYETSLGCSFNINIKVDVKEDVTLSLDKASLSVGPNPNNGQFSIDTSLQLDNCKIDVFNVYGQKIYSESNVSLGGNIKEISIPNILSGVYVLIVTHKKNRFDFKMIID